MLNVNVCAMQMCLGVLPSREVSSVYGLHELYALGEATRKGDLKAFDQVGAM